MARKSLAEKQKEISESTLKKIERLKPYNFQKGKSGNPNGRTPGSISLATEIKRAGDQVVDQTGMTYLHTLLLVMYIEAIEGNQETREMLFNRGFGTLIQKNMLMQVGVDVMRMAKELGLTSNELQGSSAIRGLLEVSELDAPGAFGLEGDSRSETSEGASTVEDNHSDS